MITLNLDVNDTTRRQNFFTAILPDLINNIDENTKTRWGKMTTQHVLEHLVWAFEISNGKFEGVCNTPEKILERVKRFLYDNWPTPMEFKNPMMGETLVALRFQGIQKAKEVLQQEVKEFLENSEKNADKTYVHPVFGPLNGEEWERSHYKHCYHHMLQLGLIEAPKAE